MTVTLGALALSDELVLDGLDVPSALHQVRKTLQGKVNVRSLAGSTSGGRQLALRGDNNDFTLAEINNIRAIQAAAEPVEMVHHRGTFQVVVTGITDVVCWSDLANPGDDEWYSATITLQEL